MTSLLFFFIFIPLLALILLTISIILSPHNPYQEKNGVFECGFHSFLGQNRAQFSISFFIEWLFNLEKKTLIIFLVLELIILLLTIFYFISVDFSWYRIALIIITFIWFFVYHYTGLQYFKILSTFFNEKATCLRMAFIFLSGLGIFGSYLFIIGILKLLIVLALEMLLDGKVNLKSIPFKFLFLMLSTYLNIFYIFIFILDLQKVYDQLCGVFNEPLYMIRRTGYRIDELCIHPQDTFSDSMNDKIPDRSRTTQEDINLANQTRKFVATLSRQKKIDIAENQIALLLASHETDENICLSYIQLAVLQSIMAGSGTGSGTVAVTGAGENKIIRKDYLYGGTLHNGPYSLQGSWTNYKGLELTGPTKKNTNFYRVFQERLNGLKNNQFDFIHPQV